MSSSSEDSEFGLHHCVDCKDGAKSVGKSMARCNLCEERVCQNHWEFQLGCTNEDNSIACKECYETADDEARYCHDEECDCDNPSPAAKKKRDLAKWRNEQSRAVAREIAEKERIDNVKFPDGKYAGKHVTDADSGYISWCAMQDEASALKYATKKRRSKYSAKAYADNWFQRWKPCIDAAKKLVKPHRRSIKFEELMQALDECVGDTEVEKEIQDFLIKHPEYKDWDCKEAQRRAEATNHLKVVEGKHE